MFKMENYDHLPFIQCSLKVFATLATQDGLAPRVSTTSWWWISWVHHWTLTSSTVPWSLPVGDGTAGCDWMKENDLPKQIGWWIHMNSRNDPKTSASKLRYVEDVEDEQCGPSRDIGDESVRMFRCSLDLYNQYGWFLTHGVWCMCQYVHDTYHVYNWYWYKNDDDNDNNDI